jgi:ATP-dependent protease Clp ATPase subunit
MTRINRKRLIVGISASICDHCIGLCNEVVAEGKAAQRWPPDPSVKRNTHCSFCGRSYAQVSRRMVDGPGISICEDCLDGINRDVYIRPPAGIDI